MLYHVIYVSSATMAFTDKDLHGLLEVAQANNARRDITGMLIYRDGNFIQFLEGEERDVKQVYHTILNDDRHDQATIIDEGPLQQRVFADWSMDFRRVADQPPFSASEVSKDESGYLDLLNEFCKNMR